MSAIKLDLRTPRDLRRSYVFWQEGELLDVVVEVLSPGTEAEDLGRFYNESATVVGADAIVSTPPSPVESGETPVKAMPPGEFEVHERYLRVSHYLVYSRYTGRLRYFKLEGGQYQEQSLNAENPLVWLDELEIGLGVWQGEFEGVTASWLRWCAPQSGSVPDCQDNWLLTDTELAQQQLEQERQAKEQAQTQLLQATRNLLATGMDLAQVAQILNLTEAQVEALRLG